MYHTGRSHSCRFNGGSTWKQKKRKRAGCEPSEVLMAGKEFGHIGRDARETWKVVNSRAGQDESQSALMLVKSNGLKALLDRGADEESGYVPADMVEVGLVPFIERNDQQSTTLKCGIRN